MLAARFCSAGRRKKKRILDAERGAGDESPSKSTPLEKKKQKPGQRCGFLIHGKRFFFV